MEKFGEVNKFGEVMLVDDDEDDDVEVLQDSRIPSVADIDNILDVMLKKKVRIRRKSLASKLYKSKCADPGKALDLVKIYDDDVIDIPTTAEYTKRFKVKKSMKGNTRKKPMKAMRATHVSLFRS